MIPYERDLAELLLKYNRKDDVIVASFHDAALDAFMALNTGIGTSCGPRTVAAFAMALMQGESVKPYVEKHVAIQVGLAPLRLKNKDVHRIRLNPRGVLGLGLPLEAFICLDSPSGRLKTGGYY